VCLKCVGWQSGDPACLWIPSLTDLGGVAQQNRDCVCGSPAWKALGAQACGVDIVQAWRAWPSRTEIMRVCISGVAALAGKAQ
jgi:hypothetical protein